LQLDLKPMFPSTQTLAFFAASKSKKEPGGEIGFLSCQVLLLF